MNNKFKLIAFVVSIMTAIAVIAIFLFNSLDAATPNQAAIKNTALELKSTTMANFEMKDKDGNKEELYNTLDKPSLVVYWASWCPDCQRQLPEIQKVYEKYGDKFNVIAINLLDQRETKEAALKYVAEIKYTFPIYFGDDHSADLLKVQTIPSMYFVDKDKHVQEVFVDHKTENNLEETLKNLGFLA